MDLVRELRHSARALLRAPGFTIVVILTLALGIGANTALFSVIRAVLVAPLPYRDPQRVVMLWSRWKDFPEKTWVGAQEYQNYVREMRSLSDLAIWDQDEVSITEGNEPERVSVAAVTPNLFRTLGVNAAFGRTLTDDDAVQGRENVIVLTWGLWQRRYGGDASVIGRRMLLDGDAYTIVGVLQDGFKLPLDFTQASSTQIFAPLVLPAFTSVPMQGGSHGYYAIGRLAPGATVASANTELRGVVDRLTKEGTYPERMRFSAFIISAVDQITGGMRRALYVLLGAVGFVLLIACANVANLLLVRGEDRRRDVSVRAALGASRSQLARALFLESLMLAVVGAVAAIAVAGIGLYLLRVIAPASLPRIGEVGIDLKVLGYTGVLAIVTAFAFGVFPALHASNPNLQETLKETGRANTGSIQRMHFRRSVVGVEVALAVVLVVGAGLMLRSFWNVLNVNPGFRSDHVLTMRLSVPSAYYPQPEQANRFYATALERVRAMPGVRQAGIVRVLPMDRDIGDAGIKIEGYQNEGGGSFAPSDWQAASDGYFEALGIPLKEGRTFTNADRDSSEQVIIVNEAFAKKFWPQGPRLDRRVKFAFSDPDDKKPWQRVVGVVADVKHNGLFAEVKPAFYRPHSQWPMSTNRAGRDMTLVLRTTGDPLQLAGPVRRQLLQLDARLPVSHIVTMDDVMGTARAQSLFTLVLLSIFGGLALLLATVGIYGVVSYNVLQRRQEMGIRAALGAEPASLVLLAVRQGVAPVAIGVAAGLVIAAIGARVMTALLVGTKPTDPMTYVGVAVTALAATLIASWLPARRAAGVNPLEALRAE